MSGEEYPELMHFHHTYRENKTASISRLVFGGYSDQSIKDEIKKCIVLCVSCHIILHCNENKNGNGN